MITNDSPRQTIPISVVANIRGAVAATPSIINFGQVRPGQAVSKVVHVRAASPFKITELESSKAELKGVEQNPGAGSDHALSVTLQAPASPGPFHAVLKVMSDLKDEAPVQVKAFATITPPG